MATCSSSFAWKPHGRGAWRAAVPGVAESPTRQHTGTRGRNRPAHLPVTHRAFPRALAAPGPPQSHVATQAVWPGHPGSP